MNNIVTFGAHGTHTNPEDPSETLDAVLREFFSSEVNSSDPKAKGILPASVWLRDSDGEMHLVFLGQIERGVRGQETWELTIGEP